MDPRIQYAKTADGVSIAFWTLGQGEALVYMAHALSHIQIEWEWPEMRAWYEQLARNRKLVRFDPRGLGLSERDIATFGLEERMLDLDAVTAKLGLKQFALFGGLHSGPVAIAYAVRHPKQVTHLILWSAYAKGSQVLESPRVRAILGLAGQDWELYTETVAQFAFGWSEGELARRYASLIRESIQPEQWQVTLAALNEVDITPLLPEIRSPTLVLHRRQHLVLDVDVARGLASRIPDASLALLEGSAMDPYRGDVQAVARTIEEFLGEGEGPAAEAEPPEAGAFRTILFTDVEASTALTQRLGDARAREVLRAHERMVREALKSHGGAEVKTMGDGFMASFSSATRALECAIAMQQAFAEHNESAQEPIRVRVGLNAGEPIAEEEDLFGTAVILAARIAGQAEGGEILASEAVRQIVAGKGFLFSDRGERALRGFEDPVRLYDVRWEG